MHVSVATLECLPGKFGQVREAFTTLAEAIKQSHPGLKEVNVLGDEASGKLLGMGIWESQEEALAAYRTPEYQVFSEKVASLLVGPPESEEYRLLDSFS